MRSRCNLGTPAANLAQEWQAQCDMAPGIWGSLITIKPRHGRRNLNLDPLYLWGVSRHGNCTWSDESDASGDRVIRVWCYMNMYIYNCVYIYMYIYICIYICIYVCVCVETFDRDMQTRTLGANNHQLHHGTWAGPPREPVSIPSHSKLESSSHDDFVWGWPSPKMMGKWSKSY